MALEGGTLKEMQGAYPTPCAWLEKEEAAPAAPTQPTPGVSGFVPQGPEKIRQAPKPPLPDGLLEASQSEGLSACQDRQALLRRIRQRAQQIVEGSGAPWKAGEIARLEAALLAAAERGCRRDASPDPIPARRT